MSTLISAAPRPVSAADIPDPNSAAAIGATAKPGAGTRALRQIVDRLDDVALLLLVVFLLPFIIIVVGSPIALLVRAVIEIAHRL